jgi:CDP-glucose 4,6-dehydratase
MRGLVDHRPIVIRHPHATRPWQHVLAPLKGYLMLAQNLCISGEKFATSWNFGPDEGDARPVHWLADYLVNAWGGGARWQPDAGEHPREHTYLSLDSAKAKVRLQWRPPMSLTRALDLIVDWFRAYASGKDMRAVTCAQIAGQPGFELDAAPTTFRAEAEADMGGAVAEPVRF